MVESLAKRFRRLSTKNPGLWLVLAVLALITVPHYCGASCYPSFVLDLLSRFGLDRGSFERILYLAPIIWSGFLFSWRGVLATSLAAVACMLPAAVTSGDPADASFQVAAVVAIGAGVSLAFVSLRKQRDDYRAALSELEGAHRLLQQYSQVARSNENRLAMLNAISTTLGESLELEKVLHKAIHLVMELMEVEVALIYSIDNERQELALLAFEGVSDDFARAVGRLPLTTGLYGQVARTGQARVMEDVSADPLFDGPEAPSMRIKIQLIVPLRFKGVTKGIISVAMRRPRTFTPGEMEMLTAVASQIGSAIGNANLYEEVRLANESLAESERRFRMLLQNANDAIWVHDLEGNITFANLAAEWLTGYTLQEMETMKVDDFLSDEDRIVAAAVRRKLFENEPVVRPYEQRITRKDGTQAVLMVTTNVVMDASRPIAFENIAKDVTEEKHVQDNVGIYLQQVRQAHEEECRQIAKGLESEIGGTLAELSSAIDDFVSRRGSLSAGDELFFEELRRRLARALLDLRQLNGRLMPPYPSDVVLIPTLRWLLSEVDRLCGITGDLKVTGAVRRLPAQVELAAFRVVQEALKRVETRQASNVAVTIDYGVGMLRVCVNDDGRANDLVAGLEDQQKDAQMVLGHVQETARKLGGRLDVTYEFGRGNAVVVEFPF